MCGRYYIPDPDEDTDFQALFEQVITTYKDSPALSEMRRGEIFPTNVVPVLTEKAPVLMKWGFPRFDGKGQIINARLETAAEKPTFKKSFESHRCLIPASCYYEWRKDGPEKHKFAIGRDRPIYMAGLYRIEKDISLPLFVILTRPAASGIEFIHNRMPVIVPETVREKWLANNIEARELLAASAEDMKYNDVV